MPSRNEIERLREAYPQGTRVELVRLEDPQAPPAGSRGTVPGVHVGGSLLAVWVIGSSLSVAYGADEVRVLIGEFTEKVKEQILAIRASGETNMFDVPMVQQIANREGYHELVIFLIDHTREYARFIVTGEIQ